MGIIVNICVIKCYLKVVYRVIVLVKEGLLILSYCGYCEIYVRMNLFLEFFLNIGLLLLLISFFVLDIFFFLCKIILIWKKSKKVKKKKIKKLRIKKKR